MLSDRHEYVDHHDRQNGSADAAGVKDEKPTPPTSEIPNGGLTAWLQVAGAFFLFFNSWCVYF